MNAIEFLQGINDISDEYIELASEKCEKTSIFTMKNFMRVTASAACVALIFIAVTSLGIGIDSSSDNESSSTPTIDTPVTVPYPTMAPSSSNAVKISKITMINVTSKISYEISDIDTDKYQSLQDEKLAVFEEFLSLSVTQDEELYLDEDIYLELKENAIYFYDELTDTQICVFDKYIEVITAGDVNAATGLFEIADSSYDFGEYFADFFK